MTAIKLQWEKFEHGGRINTRWRSVDGRFTIYPPILSSKIYSLYDGDRGVRGFTTLTACKQEADRIVNAEQGDRP